MLAFFNNKHLETLTLTHTHVSSRLPVYIILPQLFRYPCQILTQNDYCAGRELQTGGWGGGG